MGKIRLALENDSADNSAMKRPTTTKSAEKAMSAEALRAEISAIVASSGVDAAALSRAAGLDKGFISDLLIGKKNSINATAKQNILEAAQRTAVALASRGDPREVAASKSATLIAKLARRGVEPELIGEVYDALADARVEGALEQARISNRPEDQTKGRTG